MQFRSAFITLAALVLITAMPARAEDATASKVIETYADIAHAAYQDSLVAARTLEARVADLIAKPTEATLAAARSAWIAARVPYQQTEVYRFGNRIVDDWEGRVNAWPLDEGLIDYVDGDAEAEAGAEAEVGAGTEVGGAGGPSIGQVLQNLLVGRHAHMRKNPFRHFLFWPGVRKEEIDHREKVEDIIEAYAVEEIARTLE